MSKKPARPPAVKPEDAPSGSPFIASCRADAKRFSASVESGPPTREDLTAAVGYWTGFPLLLEAINGASWTADEKGEAWNALGSAHEGATNVLMHEAARQGLDAHAIYAGGRTLRAIYQQDRHRTREVPATFATWSDCAERLPEDQRTALRDGEAVFIRLCVALDLKGEARPAEEKPPAKTAGKPKRGGPARRPSAAERNSLEQRGFKFLPKRERDRFIEVNWPSMQFNGRPLIEAPRNAKGRWLQDHECLWDGGGWWVPFKYYQKLTN
jgi:hypothetical protein